MQAAYPAPMRLLMAILINISMAMACAQPSALASPQAALASAVALVPADQRFPHLEQTAYPMVPVASLHALRQNLLASPTGGRAWVAPTGRCPLPYFAAMAGGYVQLASCQYSAVTQRLAFGTLYLRDSATEKTARVEVRWERNYF